MQVSIHVPARGTTMEQATVVERTMGFNPRSRKGNDEKAKAVYEEQCVSIHVPARGTTKFEFYFSISYVVSIHVPARGTTLFRLNNFRVLEFQSTLRQGERL